METAKLLGGFCVQFGLSDIESQKARENLDVVTSGYFKGRDPKLIAWTACNMVLKRRRDGSDSKKRSEALGFDPKKVAQIEWRIVKAQTNRGDMPQDKKSEWVEFELKDIFKEISEQRPIHVSRLTEGWIFILRAIDEDVEAMPGSPESIAAAIVHIELNYSIKIYTYSEVSKLTEVPESDLRETIPIVKRAWELSPKYIPPEFGPQD
jgi:hypothetical protein